MSVGFAHSPSLETLDLSDNNIGDLGALSICNAALKAPKLRALMLAEAIN